MGRPRKDQNQKHAIKRANAANMACLGKMEEQAKEHPELKKKRMEKIESSATSVDPDNPGISGVRPTHQPTEKCSAGPSSAKHVPAEQQEENSAPKQKRTVKIARSAPIIIPLVPVNSGIRSNDQPTHKCSAGPSSAKQVPAEQQKENSAPKQKRTVKIARSAPIIIPLVPVNSGIRSNDQPTDKCSAGPSSAKRVPVEQQKENSAPKQKRTVKIARSAPIIVPLVPVNSGIRSKDQPTDKCSAGPSSAKQVPGEHLNENVAAKKKRTGKIPKSAASIVPLVPVISTDPPTEECSAGPSSAKYLQKEQLKENFAPNNNRTGKIPKSATIIEPVVPVISSVISGVAVTEQYWTSTAEGSDGSSYAKRVSSDVSCTSGSAQSCHDEEFAGITSANTDCSPESSVSDKSLFAEVGVPAPNDDWITTVNELRETVDTLSAKIKQLQEENCRLQAANKSDSRESLFAEDAEVGVPAPNRDYAGMVYELQQTVKTLSGEIKELRHENSNLRRMNMKLQETIVERPAGSTFSDIPGYPNSTWLLGVSQVSQESDYLFVKEMLLFLFPDGVGHATVTGRGSNNPKGRSKKPQEANHNIQPPAQLDPEKVQYMKDRLYERRRILQDPPGVAHQLADNINKHIGSALANNPVLRRVPTQQ